MRSSGGPILLVREAEPLVFLLVFAGVGQFHLQFEILSKLLYLLTGINRKTFTIFPEKSKVCKFPIKNVRL